MDWPFIRIIGIVIFGLIAANGWVRYKERTIDVAPSIKSILSWSIWVMLPVGGLLFFLGAFQLNPNIYMPIGIMLIIGSFTGICVSVVVEGMLDRLEIRRAWLCIVIFGTILAIIVFS